jgi:hypothetical protein
MLRGWWEGKPYENEPGSSLFFMNHYQRHWTARVAYAALDRRRESEPTK